MANKEATLLLRIKSAGEEVIESVGDALEGLASKAKWVFAALAGFVVAGAHSFKEQEDAVHSLNTAMANAGIYSAELSRKYQEMAEALQKVTLFGDEQIVSAQAAVQAHIGQIQVTEELTRAILDFATAQKMDVVSAAELVGKSIGTSTNALGRYGIEINSTSSKAEKMDQVIKSLNARFQGQAEAATEGYGSVGKLKNQMSDLLELVGKKFLPIFTVVSEQLSDLFSDAQEKGSAFQQDFLEGLVSIATGSLKVWIGVKATVQDAMDFIVLSGMRIWATTKALLSGNLAEVEAIGAEFDARKAARQKANNDLTISEMMALDSRLDQLAENRDKREEDRAKTQMEKTISVRKERDDAERLALAEQEYAKKGFLDQLFYQQMEERLIRFQMMTDQEFMQQLQDIDRKIAAENDYVTKLALIKKREQLIKDEQDKIDRSRMTSLQQFKAFLASEDVKNAQLVFGQISALQQSKHKELVILGKAAAIANITISTAQGVAAAFSLGPILGPILAPIVIAAGAMQAAKVAGVELADGGIVRARPGGVPAIIGEGGRDEAVIPLDDSRAMDRLGGGSVTIHFNGPIMGDQAQAMELARIIDRQLLELRRGNESVAFDSGVI